MCMVYPGCGRVYHGGRVGVYHGGRVAYTPGRYTHLRENGLLSAQSSSLLWENGLLSAQSSLFSMGEWPPLCAEFSLLFPGLYFRVIPLLFPGLYLRVYTSGFILCYSRIISPGLYLPGYSLLFPGYISQIIPCYSLLFPGYISLILPDSPCYSRVISPDFSVIPCSSWFLPKSGYSRLFPVIPGLGH